MKQRITVDQLKELSNDQAQKILLLWSPKDGDFYNNEIYGESFIGQTLDDYERCVIDRYDNDLPLLNIGQMIEIIVNITGYINMTVDKDGLVYKDGEIMQWCDALWDTVKNLI